MTSPHTTFNQTMKAKHDFYRKVLTLLLVGGFVKMKKVRQAMRIINRADGYIDSGREHAQPTMNL